MDIDKFDTFESMMEFSYIFEKEYYRNKILETDDLSADRKVAYLLFLESSTSIDSKDIKNDFEDELRDSDSSWKSWGKASLLNSGGLMARLMSKNNTDWMGQYVDEISSFLHGSGVAVGVYAAYKIARLFYKKMIAGKCTQLEGYRQFECRSYIAEVAAEKMMDNMKLSCSKLEKNDRINCESSYLKKINEFNYDSGKFRKLAHDRKLHEIRFMKNKRSII